MEYGFYHQDRGYWQALTTPTQEQLSAYPDGTISVPLKPSADHEWDGEAWIYVAPPEPTPEDLRAALPPITRRQLRLTLVRNGIALDDVADMIEAMPDGLAKEEARIEWDDATSFDVSVRRRCSAADRA